MPSSSSSRAERVGGGGASLKRVTAEEKRRAMNERRHEHASKLRKAKKSQLITLKRRYNAFETTTQTSSSSSLPDLARLYIQRRDIPCLAELQSTLATSDTDVLELNNSDEMMLLCNTLAFSLRTDASLEERLLASRILTNLAAMNTTTTTRTPEDDSYYSKQPEGWCQVLIHSQALPALANSLAAFAIQVDPSYMSSDGPLLEACAQCCWAVGNVAGDSQVARDAARHQAGVVPSLCSVLEKGMQLQHADISRNAAWALSNLTRGVTTSGKEFCGPTLLTPALLASVVMSPEQYVSATIQTTWWGDVAKEACWILAFLSAREDEVVNYLLEPSSTTELSNVLFGKQHVVVAAALAHRLSEAAKVVVVKSSATTYCQQELSQVQLRALQMTIPCLRAIGNIATASEGRHVATLLQETSILKSLNLLIQAGLVAPRNGDVAAVAVEATWAAGTLLCDAGMEQHVSTTIAAPALLPTLCQVVVDGSAKLDLKREAASALWNACAAPPNQMDPNVSRPTRDEFLRNIATTPGMIPSLIQLLTSSDADAVYYAIQLLNAMLRRLDFVKRDFLQANGVDALEAVCDNASQDNAYGGGQEWNGGNNESADIAADLIDDLFSHDNPMADNDEGMNVTMAASFTFSPIAVDPSQQFDFGGLPQPQQQQQQQQMGAFPDSSGGGMAGAGRGRGRGKPVPSWMNQQQSS